MDRGWIQGIAGIMTALAWMRNSGLCWRFCPLSDVNWPLNLNWPLNTSFWTLSLPFCPLSDANCPLSHTIWSLNLNWPLNTSFWTLSLPFCPLSDVNCPLSQTNGLLFTKSHIKKTTQTNLSVWG